MVEVLKVGSRKFVTEITCTKCKSKLSVVDGEWKDSGYGSERHVSCPVCKSYIVKPGSEYRGDF
jgi:ribosomal protein S27E